MDYKDVSYGQRGALPVSSDVSIGDLTQAPESGEQYMLRVRMETGLIPKVVVAPAREQFRKITDSTQPAQPTFKSTLPDSLQPSETWLGCFARYFAQEQLSFRLMLSKISVPPEFQIPGSGQLREWKQLCYESGDDASPSRNMHYALAAMDQAMALRLIKWMEAWALTDKLRRPEGMWLWYLILKLDNLLDHDDTHVLRELCRKLKLIRANIGHNIAQNPEHLLTYRADEIASINILIASVTRGYRQRDLEND